MTDKKILLNRLYSAEYAIVTDIVDTATRSRMMSGIRSRNTKPEILVRSWLHRQGFRFRLHVGNLPGKPDIVLARYHAVIFVHGCFWHGHNCNLFKLPQTRTEFWQDKITRNRLRDEQVKQALIHAGWRVGTIWECAMRGTGKNTDSITCNISDWLHGNQLTWEIRS